MERNGRKSQGRWHNMVTKGYALIDAATDKVLQTQIPVNTTLDMIYKSVQVGYEGLTGEDPVIADVAWLIDSR